MGMNQDETKSKSPIPKVSRIQDMMLKEADFKVIDDWVNPNESVLDLDAGEEFLEYLREEKQVFGLGVDHDLNKGPPV